jgi:DNA-binding transcriptional MerR regulator/predicted enzyme related to lactoylglutathione lyase
MSGMTDAHQMSIGTFAQQTGLSVPALRYYDQIGLLPPATVDPSSGYRRYQTDQLKPARDIYMLRALGLPIDLVRDVVSADPARLLIALGQHRDQLAQRIRLLNEITAAVDAQDNDTIDHYLHEFTELGASMPDPTTCRPVQITIHADDLPRAVTFYTGVFGGEFNESTSSIPFGTWKTDSFFLLTIEPQGDSSNYPGRNACFTFLVDDVDAMHTRALTAGATEVHPPQDFAWKPRTSIVDDPSGNRIALSQA